MNENLLTVKAMIAACFTALGAFLGWKGVMLFAWFGVMCLQGSPSLPDSPQALSDTPLNCFQGA